MACAPEIFLKKHSDYQAAYAIARKGRSQLMGWFVSSRPVERRSETTGMRIGLTVPKALGKAVDRNRIKRRMRAAIRQQSPESFGAPLDLILHPRRAVLDCEYLSLVREVGRVLREVGGARPF